MFKTFLKGKIWLFIAAVAAIILVSVLFPSFLPGVKNISLRALLVPVRAYSGLRQYFLSRSELTEENRRMKGEVAKLSLEVEKLKDLKYENERLRDLLKFKSKFGFDTVSAEILARNPNDWIDTIFISKGTASGIRKNSAVCSAKGLMGKVVEADKDASSVMLITHPNFKTGGVIRKTRINGIVVGSGDGLVRMIYIPLDADVKEGSVVVTSGFSRIFPKGIAIGRIASVRKSRTGLYKYAVIKPFVNPFDQEQVLCIK